MDKILSLISLEIGYISGKSKKVLLPPLNAVARRGELIAVIGRNGIGKSTLLRTIAGLQVPLSGELICNYKEISKYQKKELAKKVGFLSTEIIKADNMRVSDLITLGRFPYTNWIGKIEEEDSKAINEAIKITAIESLCDKFITELSDGERQKAMIARILAQDTDLMIMDEPTAFLDVAGKYEILQLLHSLSIDKQKTIIFSTHDLQMALSQADKIWLILDNMLLEGSPEDLMITGAFNHLFDSSKVELNINDGTFVLRNTPSGAIFVKGNGIIHHWTEKAVKRAGFLVSKEKAETYIEVPEDTDQHWKIITPNETVEFISLYELVRYLNHQKSAETT